MNDGEASNARLLTQLIPSSPASEKLPALDPSLPSLSEALAVLAGNTLLLSAIDSPFIHFWNYSQSVNTLKEPQYQAFNATLKTQSYASGGTEPWQGIFYLILIGVFFINVCCLLYFAVTGSLVTDFIEPQNLFSLSINSPPSAKLEGACGAGPEGAHYLVPWHIARDEERDHLFIKGGERDGKKRHKRLWSGTTEFEICENGDGGELGREANMYSKIGRKRVSLMNLGQR